MSWTHRLRSLAPTVDTAVAERLLQSWSILWDEGHERATFVKAEQEAPDEAEGERGGLLCLTAAGAMQQTDRCNW